MIRNLPIAAQELNLIAAGVPEAVAIWEEQNGRRVLTDRQEIDPETGELLWTCHAMTTGDGRPELIAVRVPARQQPVVSQLAPVHFEGLTVRVTVGKDGRLAGYWSARGVSDPAQAPSSRRSGSESKPEPAAA